MEKINLEPNWHGVYNWFMHMKKTDPATFKKMTSEMGEDWTILEAMAKDNGWNK